MKDPAEQENKNTIENKQKREIQEKEKGKW